MVGGWTAVCDEALFLDGRADAGKSRADAGRAMEGDGDPWLPHAPRAGAREPNATARGREYAACGPGEPCLMPLLPLIAEAEAGRPPVARAIAARRFWNSSRRNAAASQ